MLKIDPAFTKAIDSAGEFNAQACMNCGTCTALCPMDLSPLPRELFRYVVLGVEAKIHDHTETIFSCLLCRFCQVNCPAEVKIADNVRTLRVYINNKVNNL